MTEITNKIKNIKVTIEEENLIKNNGADKLPLNPTSQGFSGQSVRKQLSQAVTGARGSVLALMIEKFSIIEDFSNAVLLVEVKLAGDDLTFIYADGREFKFPLDVITNGLEQEIITTNERIDEIQDDINLSVKIDYLTITRTDNNELQVSMKIINDINSRTKNNDFIAYQQEVEDFLNDKLDKKPDGVIDLINAFNKIDARYLEIDLTPYELQSNKVTTFNNPTNAQYPSAKLVKDYLDNNIFTKTEIDAKLSATYKAKGTITGTELLAITPTSDNEGFVYNISTEFSTTIDFIEGAGITHKAGENVVIVEISEGVYKFDVLSGFVDLSNYVEKDDIKEDVVFQATSLDSLTSTQKSAIVTQIGDVLTNGEIDKEKFRNFILEVTLSGEKYYYQCVQYFMIDDIVTLYFTSSQTTEIIELNVDTLTPANSTLTNYKYADLTPYELQNNKVSSWSETTNDTRYPSEKLVKDSLNELENTIQGVSDLSPYHYEGTFIGGDVLQNDFDNLIVGFEDLREGIEFNETKLQGSYFVCSSDSSFYFNTTYHWSAAEGTGKTSAITYTWAAPYDLNGLTEINMKAGDIISILDFSYNSVSNTISTLIKVEKNPEETFVVKNESITGATKPKITYDAKGLVTAGADLTADDIPTHQHTKSEITDFPTIPANKSYSKTITTANWTDKKYAVTISGLEVSDTVLLSGADDIFTTNGLTATITANTLTFEVETLPTVSIDVNFTVIKTEGGTL